MVTKLKSIAIYLFVIGLFGWQETFSQDWNKALTAYTTELAQSVEEVDENRKAILRDIGDFMVGELEEDGKVNMLVICTHNSRRSHIGQVWLQTSALFYGVNGVNAFSGGTEATAFNKNAVDALERAGFGINTGRGENPRYEVIAGSSKWIHYSKKYTDSQNPSSDFGAIMVCSEADKSCPVVQGADARFSLPFEDPRYSDGTPSQNLSYDKTVKLIGKEMFYLMNYIKNKQVEALELSKQ